MVQVKTYTHIPSVEQTVIKVKYLIKYCKN